MTTMSKFNHLPRAIRPAYTQPYNRGILAVFFSSDDAKACYDALKAQGAKVHSLEMPKYGNSSFELAA